MRLWRISEYADLSGAGGLYAQGRWNRIGQRMVYTTESSALALLEMLVRRTRNTLPPPYQLLEIEAPDELAITQWPNGGDVRDRDLTRAWGEAFLRVGATPLARVPSVIAPHSWNVLVNPLHADASRITIRTAARWPWDARLFQG